MVKKVLIFGIIILLLLMGILYLFPCSANVESVKIYSLNNDTEILNYWLKEGKWNFNPQKKYLQLSYTVAVHPHLPFTFGFQDKTFETLRNDFNVIVSKPAMPWNECATWGLFKVRHVRLNVIVECPKDMNPRTIISNIELKLHAYISAYISYPSWFILRVKIPENLYIEEH